jgi:hypothetical protein
MAKAKKKSAKKSSPRDGKQALAARAARAVTDAIGKAKKGRGADDMDVHVHVGDVVMMGFDEAVDRSEPAKKKAAKSGAKKTAKKKAAKKSAKPKAKRR